MMQSYAVDSSFPSSFSNVNDDIASSSSAAMSQAAHIVNPLCVAAGAAGTGAALKDDDKLNLDENSLDEKIVDKEILKNGDACNTDNIDIDAEDQAYHNAGTMRYRKKTGSNNTDLDSIEHLDYDDDAKKSDGLEDDIDSVSFNMGAFADDLPTPGAFTNHLQTLWSFKNHPRPFPNQKYPLLTETISGLDGSHENRQRLHPTTSPREEKVEKPREGEGKGSKAGGLLVLQSRLLRHAVHDFIDPLGASTSINSEKSATLVRLFIFITALPLDFNLQFIPLHINGVSSVDGSIQNHHDGNAFTTSTWICEKREFICKRFYLLDLRRTLFKTIVTLDAAW